MKKFYDEFLYVPKHEIISEKVLINRIAVIVSTILFCLAAMSISAYAHFSYNISSNTNTVNISNYEINLMIDVIDDNGNVIDSINTITSNYKSYIAEMQADKTYRITIKHTEKSTAKTGFVLITAEGCADSYHTQQIGRNDDGTTKTISFNIKLTSDTKVKFLTHWGTSSYYDAYENKGQNEELYVVQDELITLNVVNNQTDNVSEQNSSAVSETSTVASSSQTISSVY